MSDIRCVIAAETVQTNHLFIISSISYRFPSKRSFWLSIWYSSIEKVERENPWALAFDEQEEDI